MLSSYFYDILGGEKWIYILWLRGHVSANPHGQLSAAWTIIHVANVPRGVIRG
jgi:hypothetical protein